MAEQSDGGRTALAGFLYQTLGLLGVAAGGWSGAAIHGDGHGLTFDAANLEPLFRVTRQASIAPEGFDEDGFIVDTSGRYNDRRCILAQFKYTRTPSAPTVQLQPHDFREIVARLDIAGERARTLGYIPTAFLLLTNRLLSPKAPGTPRVHTLTPANDLLLECTDPKQVPVYLINQAEVASWVDLIRGFARQLGAFPDEITRGINMLVGQLLGGSNEIDTTISLESLVAAFTGAPQSCNLTPAAVAVRTYRHLEQLSWKPTTPLARRTVVEEIAQAAAQRAIVVVRGMGGCGKTAALYQWAEHAAGFGSSGADLTSRRSFIHLAGADEAQPRWPTDIVCTWANTPAYNSRRAEEADKAFDRLVVANPDAISPLFYFGLDGLDEVHGSTEREDAVRELLRWFRKADKEALSTGVPPRKVLVVTCRAGATEVLGLLHERRDGFDSDRNALTEVSVGDFTNEELLDAAAFLPEALYQRLADAVKAMTLPETRSLMIDRLDMEGRIDASPNMPVDGEILELLRHPAAWGVFSSLPDEQQAILNGDHGALGNLARGIVKRMCNKACERYRTMFRFPELVFRILCAIAQRTSADTQLAERVWRAAALEAFPDIGPASILTLYREACSSGLVFEDSKGWSQRGTWWWRHRLVWEYLSAAEEQEEST